MTKLPPDVPPIDLAFEAPDGSPSTKPAISPWSSPAIVAARVAAVAGPIGALCVAMGWLTTEEAAAIAGAVTTIAGVVAEWGRRNSGAQPSPIKPGIL